MLLVIVVVIIRGLFACDRTHGATVWTKHTKSFCTHHKTMCSQCVIICSPQQTIERDTVLSPPPHDNIEHVRLCEGNEVHTRPCVGHKVLSQEFCDERLEIFLAAHV